MGNKDSKSHASVFTQKYDYSEDDIHKLRNAFEELSNESKKALSLEAFAKRFSEHSDVGKLVYTWMQGHSSNIDVTFDCFLGCMELILKSPYQYNLSTYSKISFDKYHLFYAIINAPQNLGHIEKVSFEEALKFFTYVINIFFKSPSDGATKVAKSAVLGIFNDKESISWNDFTYSIKKTFPQLNTVIRTYFIGKLMDSSVLPKLPAMSDKSGLIAPEYFALLIMSNPRYQKSDRLDMIYTTSKSGTSFNRLMFSIQGYEGPTFIILEHHDEGESNYGVKKGESFIFGGYTNSTWNEQLGYQGDSDGFLFSLSPKFRPFYSQRGEKGKNYWYLNSKKIQNSKYKVGLGFGGEDFKNFRIWIDDEIESESYARAEDNTYETGFLVDAAIRKFNVHAIEVWGIGGQKALDKQNDFRDTDAKITEGQRKVDRKAFLGNQFDKEMFFGKTFAAANNRDDQTDFKAEMQ